MLNEYVIIYVLFRMSSDRHLKMFLEERFLNLKILSFYSMVFLIKKKNKFLSEKFSKIKSFKIRKIKLNKKLMMN